MKTIKGSSTENFFTIEDLKMQVMFVTSLQSVIFTFMPRLLLAGQVIGGERHPKISIER